jgi:hypothetical protein
MREQGKLLWGIGGLSPLVEDSWFLYVRIMKFELQDREAGKSAGRFSTRRKREVSAVPPGISVGSYGEEFAGEPCARGRNEE